MFDPAAIVKAIDAAYDAETPRRGSSRIGASAMGDPCDAAINLALRGAPEIQPKPFLKRIFKMGHYLETAILKDLTRAGLSIITHDPLTGGQVSYTAYDDHVICRLDGLIEDEGGVVVGLEIKSMNRALWTAFKDKGLAISHPQYISQVQMMMGMSGIRQFLVVGYCKDNSQYHAELINYDLFIWNYMKARIERIMQQDGVKRIAKTPLDFRCDGCFKMGACWGTQPVEPKCSMCVHAVPGTDRSWWCTKHNAEAKGPCADYEKYVPADRD